MAFSITWNAAFEADPEDTDQLSEGALRIRNLKIAIRERMEDGGIDWDGLGLTNVAIADRAFATGVKALFVQAAAPTNWTKDVDQNDRVIRVNSSAGGGTAGSWTVSGLTNGLTGSHVLAEADIPNILGTFQVAAGGGVATGVFSSVADGLRHEGGASSGNKFTLNFGGDGGHTHTGPTISSDGVWRPAYLDVIKCTKDAPS